MKRKNFQGKASIILIYSCFVIFFSSALTFAKNPFQGSIIFFLLDLPNNHREYIVEQADFMHYYGQVISWLEEKGFMVSTEFQREFHTKTLQGASIQFSSDHFMFNEGIILIKPDGQYFVTPLSGVSHDNLIKRIEKYFAVKLR